MKSKIFIFTLYEFFFLVLILAKLFGVNSQNNNKIQRNFLAL